MSVDSSRSASEHWSTYPCGTYQALDNYLCSFSELNQIFNVKLLQQSWQSKHIPYSDYSGKNVLEIGIGVGFELLRFASYGAFCSGLDVTDRHINNTLNTFNMYSKICDLRKEDISVESSSFSNHQFDLIYSFGVIHHIENRSLLYREVQRLLKPDGKIIFVTYNLNSLSTLSLYAHSLLNLNLFKYGINKVNSTIEAGVDINSPILPHVELKSRSSWSSEFNSSGFRLDKASTHQLYFHRLGYFNKYLAPFEPFLGWYNLFELSI